jgi:hypothetical protein
MLPSACRSIKVLRRKQTRRWSIAISGLVLLKMDRPALPIMARKMESLDHLPKMRHEGD